MIARPLMCCVTFSSMHINIMFLPQFLHNIFNSHSHSAYSCFQIHFILTSHLQLDIILYSHHIHILHFSFALHGFKGAQAVHGFRLPHGVAHGQGGKPHQHVCWEHRIHTRGSTLSSFGWHGERWLYGASGGKVKGWCSSESSFPHCYFSWIKPGFDGATLSALWDVDHEFLRKMHPNKVTPAAICRVCDRECLVCPSCQSSANTKLPTVLGGSSHLVSG